MNRSQLFDALKGWSIIGIVLVHSGMNFQSQFINKFISAGKYGVQMFFIISSFFLYLSLSKIFNKENQIKSIKFWYINKLIRLMPLYYLFNIVFLILNGNTATYWIGNHSHLTIINILSNFIFLHGFSPFYINSININWYIGDLAILIILAPLIFKKINTISKTIISFSIYVVLYYFTCKFLLLIPYGENYFIWEVYWGSFSILAVLPLFFIGLLLYQLVIKENSIVFFKGNKLLAYSLLILSLYLFCVGIVIKNDSLGLSLSTACGIIFFIIIVSQIMHPCIVVVNPVVAVLGRYSYGIYLSHIILKSVLDFKVNGLYNFFILLIISFIVSLLCTRFIEKPCLDYLNKV